MMFCPKCFKELKKSDNPEYSYQCLECDEDFYTFEALTYEEKYGENSCEICEESCPSAYLIDTECFINGGVGSICPDCYKNF